MKKNVPRTLSLQRLAVVFLLQVVLIACSTKKNTFIARQYHTLTAHYNVFFNGNEALKEGVATLENNHQDNFLQILPVFKEGTEKDRQAIVANMTRAEEKGYKTIVKHSMEFGGIEYNKWIDDSYLLIGKANYYKGDYLKAKNIFELVTFKYKKNTERFEAHLWLAKIALNEKKETEAFKHLNTVRQALEEHLLPKKLQKFFYYVAIDYYNRTKAYEESIAYLQKALKATINNKLKTRLLFILAQVYQAQDNHPLAFKTYQEVIRKNPPYDLAFHAKINSALTYDPSYVSKKIDLKTTLLKMAKEKKNEDYLDEIYYALAIYELKRKNENQALDYLRLSAQKSTKNVYQKTLSYLTLANYLFDKKKYREAQAYYDTLVTVIPKDYPDRDLILQRQNVLSRLVKYLTTIEREDSLQKVAKMPEKERLEFIDKLIQQYLQEEERKKQEEKAKLEAMYQNATQNLASTNASWYFYNPQTVNFGKIEFRKRWGNRPLEDLWRLSNKQVIVSFEEQNTEKDTLAQDSSAAQKNPRDRSYYLKDLPLTPEKLDQSNKKIAVSLFQAGFIYKVELNECSEAVKYLERFIQEFKDHENRATAAYLTYDCYKKLQNVEKAEYYRNLILSSYPESEYAKVLSDTNYWSKVQSQKNVAEVYYEKTYQAFKEEQCQKVLQMSDSALKNFVDPVLLSRFTYLKMLCIGKIVGKDSLIILLKKEIPNLKDPVKKEAENLLAMLNPLKQNNEQGNSPAAEQKNNTQNATYQKPMDTDIHIFVCILDAKNSSINSIKTLFSNFNQENYSTYNLSVGSIILTDERVMYSISHFKTKQDAMNYYKHVTQSSSLLKTLTPANPTFFVISATNYPIFYKLKNEKDYLEFFRKYYLEP
jgi:tetratricopeptide (TPR) repeat protein